MIAMAEDRDPLRLPSFWRLQCLGWGCYFLVSLLGSIPTLLANPGSIRDHVRGPLLLFLVSSALRPACRRLLRGSPSWLGFGLRAGALSLLAGTATALLANLVLTRNQGLTWQALLAAGVQFAFVMFLWCSLYFGIKQWQEAARERERLLRAETAARDARLSALRSQLNPHFLFNSLNAVSTLVLDGKAEAASRMLAQIGELLRASLDSGAAAEVPLSQEMALTEQYLAIEQSRLGDRLRVEIAVDPASVDALVPSMLLQPLVENAVRHGVAVQVEGGVVGIGASLAPGELRLVVRNSGPPGAARCPPSDGIGLRNTAERLATLYGEQHAFALRWPATGGCEVTVALPLRKAALREIPCAS